jgi:glycosyltransferase involved in cell wall biosynthesis
MKVSIIIPTYNEAHVLTNCLNSLMKQDISGFEIIVVDDGSTDGTVSILKQFSTDHKNIIFLKQDHKGAGSARNLGAKEAKGEILVFVDADMTFEKDFVTNLIKPIESKDIVGTFSKDELVLNWNNIWAKCWNWNANLPDKHRLPVNYPDQQKVFRAIKRTEFLKVGGFTPGGYTDDWSLSEKLNTQATSASNAVFYHSNPESLGEVFTQAKWSAKRKYKAGLFGVCIALIRVNLLFSLIVGTVKGIMHMDLRFVLFKVIYDFGQFIGIIDFYVTKKGSK